MLLAGLRTWWRGVTEPRPRREGAYVVKSIDGYSGPFIVGRNRRCTCRPGGPDDIRHDLGCPMRSAD